MNYEKEGIEEYTKIIPITDYKPRPYKIVIKCVDPNKKSIFFTAKSRIFK